jgi:hypothetical protein
VSASFFVPHQINKVNALYSNTAGMQFANGGSDAGPRHSITLIILDSNGLKKTVVRVICVTPPTAPVCGHSIFSPSFSAEVVDCSMVSIEKLNTCRVTKTHEKHKAAS